MFDIKRVADDNGKIKEMDTKIDRNSLGAFAKEYAKSVEPGQSIVITPSE